MKLNCLPSVFVACLLGLTQDLFAQPTAAERREFELTKAKAEKGDAQAQLALGFLYGTGSGVSKDLGKAAKWHRKAAEQGLARAQFVLATDYAEGLGVKPNQEEAAKWFSRAAEQKLPEGQFALGQCYANGQGVNADPVEAVKWYKLAADQNYLQAEGELGECFLDGSGVATDIVEALKWIRRAAQQGYAPAQDRLGVCYMRGVGVPKDFVQAYKWFNLAAAQGGAKAPDIKLDLAKAESNLSPEQIAEAQRLAREFKPHLPTEEISSADKDDVTRSGSATEGPSVVARNLPGGTVNVSAQDQTSDVYVDGSFVGNPPAKLSLTEGSHVIEIKKAGFKDYRKEIKVINGSELSLHVTLEPR